MKQTIISFIGFMALVFFFAGTAVGMINQDKEDKAQLEVERINVCKYTLGSTAAYLANCAGTYHFKEGDDIIDQDGEHHVYNVK